MQPRSEPTADSLQLTAKFRERVVAIIVQYRSE